jgi:hypothetical protein
MRGLDTLIRLHKLRLTENQRRLNGLQVVAQGFMAEIDSLAQAAQDEASSSEAVPETAHTLGSFVQATIARRSTLQESLAGVEREIMVIRTEVADAFRELKRYELIAAKRAADVALTQRRRDRRAENEIGMTMHRQKNLGKSAKF